VLKQQCRIDAPFTYVNIKFRIELSHLQGLLTT
jgi:hypothetical protein